jgi:hypothetical protein
MGHRTCWAYVWQRVVRQRLLTVLRMP